MLYDQLSRNRWMTAVLFMLFTGLVVGLALALELVFLGGAGGGVYVAIVVIVGVLIFSWFAADRAVLSALRARPPRPDVPEERNLTDVVEGLALAAGLPVPAIYVIDDPAPNAYLL